MRIRMTVAIVMMMIENQIEAIRTHLPMIMTVAGFHRDIL